MQWGCQTLKAVLDLAAQHRERLDQEFTVPVLVVAEAPAESDVEPRTVVTAVTKAYVPRGTPSSFVVPIQGRPGRLGNDPRLSFGRAEICDVVLPFGPVSKHHGYFVQGDTGWQLVDVGSTNGSAVQGRLLAANTPQALPDGASVNFGALQGRFLSGPSFVKYLREKLA